VSTAILDKIRAERDDVRNAAVAMAEAEDFSPDDPTFVDLQTRADDLDKRASTLVGLFSAQSAADALDGRIAKAARRADDRATETRPESWGQSFVRSDVFTSYAGRGTSPRLNLDYETRALPTGISDLVAAGFKGATLSVDTTAPAPPTPLLDVMTTVNVSTNAIEYVSWAKAAGGAAKVAEKATKPSVEYAPTVVPDTLDMIAVYTQLTRQLIEDQAAVRSYIDGALRADVMRAEEAEAAAVLAAANLPTAPVVAGTTTLLEAIRVGIGTVQAAGYNPNAVLLNPMDWAALDIAVMVESVDGPIRKAGFWGLATVAANSQPEGTATVGDFRTGTNHFVRSGVSLYVTDSHADTFLSNVFTLLAERRSKTAVIRPAAFCECTAG
jgi:hypothetical protein